MAADRIRRERPSCTRQVHARIGLWCWTTDRNQIDLPAGLGPGKLALIVDQQNCHWIILCQNRRWEVDIRCLEIAREYQTRRGQWLPEFDPRVRSYFLKKLAEVRVFKQEDADSGTWREHWRGVIRRIKHEIRRNGWEVEDLPDDLT